jgi:hypothetical protein
MCRRLYITCTESFLGLIQKGIQDSVFEAMLFFQYSGAEVAHSV